MITFLCWLAIALMLAPFWPVFLRLTFRLLDLFVPAVLLCVIGFEYFVGGPLDWFPLLGFFWPIFCPLIWTVKMIIRKKSA